MNVAWDICHSMLFLYFSLKPRNYAGVMCQPLLKACLLNAPFKLKTYLRTNVTNSQTFGGNSSNIDFVHILQLDKP